MLYKTTDAGHVPDRTHIKFPIRLGLTTIVLLSLLFTCLPVLAKGNKLSKIGRVKTLGDGVGCNLFFLSDKSGSDYPHNPIYHHLTDPIMNFDGKDTKLKLISSSYPKGNRIINPSLKTYKANNLIIKIETRTIDAKGEDMKGTIKIMQNGQSKTIKVVGFCGC